MRVGVFVLGMHRSGTSAATRLVNLLGVETCVESDVFSPSPDNPRGNWESTSLTAFNDRLLGALGCDWTCPPALEAGWDEDLRLAGLYQEAAGLFPRIFSSEQWVWKDPRNCVVLPFWTRLLDVQPIAVLVHRSPLEVAESLEKRGHFDEAHALALWERYLRLGLRAVTGLPTVVTEYAALLDDPLGWCNGMSEFLGRAGVRSAMPRRDEVLDFIDRSLWRSRFPTGGDDSRETLSRPQHALLEALATLVGAHESLAPPALPPESASTETLLAERRSSVRNRPSWTGA